MATAHLIGETHPLNPYKKLGALDRLLSILESKQIIASPMPFLPHSPEAVCFTECIWDALIRHTEQYSQYGLVFSKRTIHQRGGGPVFYMRADTLLATQAELPSAIETMVVPFDPDAIMRAGVRQDWLHEREWRLPDSLSFEYNEIEYVIVETVQDVTTVSQRIGTQNIPLANYIPIEVYRTIDTAWSRR